MSDQSLDLEKVLGYEFPQYTHSYTERDVALYALGVGAGRDPMDMADLRFVYELHGEDFQVLPTFAVAFLSSRIWDVPGLTFHPMMLLHGEHYLEIKRPLSTSATVTNHAKIAQVYDKGSGALLIADTVSRDEDGNEIALNRASLFIRKLTGFGGERGPSSGGSNKAPERAPDAVVEEQTMPNQALIYRLSGDANPLHADPGMAAVGGFKQPILHGLCTFGFAARAVLKTFADDDPARFKSIKVRFARHVFPGETLVTEMWRESDTRIIFRTRVAERDDYALTNAAVELTTT